jgi:hypothetical protein
MEHMVLLPFIMEPNAAVYFTISMGVRPSPAAPPMVPLMPEMDLINVTVLYFFWVRKFNAPKTIAKFVDKIIVLSNLSGLSGNSTAI